MSNVRADSVLARAISVMGVEKTGGRIRASDVSDMSSDLFQADRMYAPIPYRPSTGRALMDWSTGALRMGTILSTPVAAAMIPPNGGAPIAPPAAAARTITAQRALDPWAVLADWRRSQTVRVSEECMYRDFWRTVLTRTDGPNGTERLFMDKAAGFPVKLERREPHTLWGDALNEYVWTVWQKVGPVVMPVYSFRLIDGETETMRRSTQTALIPADSAGVMTIPAALAPAPAPPGAVASGAPDTVRVSPTTFLLVTPAYTNTVTLQRDTIFILDAQTDEARARADSAWIGKLFPGKHPMVLVVSDLAWPHIGGVRYWVANGVPIVTQRASKDFLERVIAHKWTLTPDLLEQRRARVKPRVRAIDDGIDLAGGALKLRSIASEGALLAYIPAERFVYVGDYIQQGALRPPTAGLFDFTYTDEVFETVRRNAFDPERFAAMHVTLTPWSRIAAKYAP